MRLLLFLGEKPYKCAYCSFSSASATNLKTHEKNHTNKLPFSCHQCNVGFKIKEDFTKHVETAHNGIIQVHASENNEDEIVAVNTENASDPLQDTTVIQYIFQEEPREGQQPSEAPQYTIISDVSAYENAVIEDSKARILSTTHNQDGSTTFMMTTDENATEVEDPNADQNIVYLINPIDEGNSEGQTVLVKQDNA